VRSTAPGRHVTVEVSGLAHEITIAVIIDDSPMLGYVPITTALG